MLTLFLFQPELASMFVCIIIKGDLQDDKFNFVTTKGTQLFSKLYPDTFTLTLYEKVSGSSSVNKNCMHEEEFKRVNTYTTFGEVHR